jgi:hypothetical protein
VHSLSVMRVPAGAKLVAHTVKRIGDKVQSSEFTAVTIVTLLGENERHRFVAEPCVTPAWKAFRRTDSLC